MKTSNFDAFLPLVTTSLVTTLCVVTHASTLRVAFQGDREQRRIADG